MSTAARDNARRLIYVATNHPTIAAVGAVGGERDGCFVVLMHRALTVAEWLDEHERRLLDDELVDVARRAYNAAGLVGPPEGEAVPHHWRAQRVAIAPALRHPALSRAQHELEDALLAAHEIAPDPLVFDPYPGELVDDVQAYKRQLRRQGAKR